MFIRLRYLVTFLSWSHVLIFLETASQVLVHCCLNSELLDKTRPFSLAFLSVCSCVVMVVVAVVVMVRILLKWWRYWWCHDWLVMLFLDSPKNWHNTVNTFCILKWTYCPIDYVNLFKQTYKYIPAIFFFFTPSLPCIPPSFSPSLLSSSPSLSPSLTSLPLLTLRRHKPFQTVLINNLVAIHQHIPWKLTISMSRDSPLNRQIMIAIWTWKGKIYYSHISTTTTTTTITFIIIITTTIIIIIIITTPNR